MKKIVVALVGQPNVGKSHLLNSISGANLKVGNFAGVTVEKAEATLLRDGYKIDIIDLPGSYSLDDFAKDEKVTKEFLIEGEYDIILNVLDSTNLERNLSLTSELLELDKRMVVALNMDDEAIKEGVFIDEKELSELLGVDCIKTSSLKKTNLDVMVDMIIHTVKEPKKAPKFYYSDAIEDRVEELVSFMKSRNFKLTNHSNRSVAIGLLKQDRTIYKMIHEEPIYAELLPLLNNTLEKLHIQFKNRDSNEIFADERDAFARGACLEVIKNNKKNITSVTQKIDSIMINKYLGIPIFLFLMWGLFQLTFTLGQVPMDYIEAFFKFLGDTAGEFITNKPAKSLIVDGIIAGVGTVLLFLPNIMILFLGIALLETTGYMARVAFVLDGFFHKFGLHGKSFIPLVTGFGCSIPAYMAARTLKSERDRLLTMFIIGFMSCGARLPVYVLFAGAFFTPESAGNVLFAIYVSGAFLGLIAAKVLRLTVFRGDDEPFVMEMPKYRLPSVKLIWFTIYSKSIMYLKKAGTFIFMASIFIWFISSYPKNIQIEDAYTNKIETALEADKNIISNEMKKKLMENTYLGFAGKAIEPIFKPLGFDWRMSVATLSGLAAKEVIVSTLGVLYSIGSEIKEEDDALKNIISREIPFASAIAFIVFVMVYLPCIAATAVFTKEAGGKKYTVYLVLFTFITAWTLAFIAYHSLLLLGY
ncbi:ferrous iron transport protein B [Sulfurimonas sp.]|uniref:ferrous iron transport protein B n=1 Tax=Sulfurimonas sp. TaxID=2022749 RepID=UPI00262BE0A4|nr:ferrous iron transport protein B [Sulfurimonas sp.]MDD5158166.1 ferrous iron transport protein B [Sulfurimonas sp.]